MKVASVTDRTGLHIYNVKSKRNGLSGVSNRKEALLRK